MCPYRDNEAQARMAMALSAAKSWACPTDDLLAAYIDRALDDRERARVEEHVSSCAYCMAQVGAALDADAKDLPEVPPALLASVRHGTQKRLASGVWRWATASAVVASFVIAGSLLLHRPQSPPPTTGAQPEVPVATKSGAATAPQTSTERAPSSSATPATRSQSSAPLFTLLAPRPGSTVPARELRLRWNEVAGALAYEVRVTTEDGSLVWTAQVQERDVLVPSDVPLQAGQTYFAWVRAPVAGGKVIRTDAVAFKVSR